MTTGSPDDQGTGRAIALIVVVAVALVALVVSGAFAYREYRFMKHGMKVRVEIRDRTSEMSIVKSSEKAVGFFLYFYDDDKKENHLRKFSLETALYQSAISTPDHLAEAYYLDDEPTESVLAVEREPKWVVIFLVAVGVLAAALVYFGIKVIPREVWSGGGTTKKSGKSDGKTKGKTRGK